jgi:Protein of unknown function (DUF3311)
MAEGELRAGHTPERDGPSVAAYVTTVILLGAALVALLWVPSYARLTPSLAGIPFFYWYSILWLLINAVCQFAAYQLIVALPRRRREGAR